MKRDLTKELNDTYKNVQRNRKITWTRKYNEIWTPKEIGEHIKGFLHRTNNTIRGYKTIILKSIDFDNNYVWTVLCTTKLEALLVNEHDDKVISLEWLRNEEYNLHVEKQKNKMQKNTNNITKKTKEELIERLNELLSKEDVHFNELEKEDIYIHRNYVHTTDFRTSSKRVQEVVDIITALYEAKGV